MSNLAYSQVFKYPLVKKIESNRYKFPNQEDIVTFAKCNDTIKDALNLIH